MKWFIMIEFMLQIANMFPDRNIGYIMAWGTSEVTEAGRGKVPRGTDVGHSCSLAKIEKNGFLEKNKMYVKIHHKKNLWALKF